MSERLTREITADLDEWIGYMQKAQLDEPALIGTADQVLANMSDAVTRLIELEAKADEAVASANRWAYKCTLLVLWIKGNCTPEQQAAARAASQVPGDERDDTDACLAVRYQGTPAFEGQHGPHLFTYGTDGRYHGTCKGRGGVV